MRPPALAFWLMNRFGVSESLRGDLVEQFLKGRSAAWFWRQALTAIGVTMMKQVRLHWTAIVAWALVVFTAMTVRGLFDTFAPPVSYGPRSALTTYVAVGTYLTAGAYGAFQIGRLRSGIWLATLAHIVGHLLTIVFTLALYFGVIARDLTKLREFEMTGGFDEVFFLSLMLLPIVAVLGLIGGTLGTMARRRLRTA